MSSAVKSLQLATGSHTAGSGKGCAMNMVSWENGDTTITDFPACTARPLARLVQIVNDSICTHRNDGFLCGECSVTVLNLAHQTVGTASATREQQAAWCAELLDSSWGLTSFRDIKPQPAIVCRQVADLYRRRAMGDEPAFREWRAARIYAADAYAAVDAYAYVAYAYAADAYAAAADAYAYAAAVAGARRQAKLSIARSAIEAWHRICGTTPASIASDVTGVAITRMQAKS